MKYMYKKGDYIVCIKDMSSNGQKSAGYKEDYCFKVNDTTDSKDGTQVLWPTENKITDCGWHCDTVRLATDKEIAHYNKIGEPYNVCNILVNTTELVVGKWYKSVGDWTKNTFAKFRGLNANDEFLYSECIMNDNHRTSNGSWRKCKVYQEVNIVEILAYLSEDHPDKVMYYQNKNNKSHGNSEQVVKVQRKTAQIRGGERKPGCSIPGRRSRTIISIGHLSNQEISCS